MHAIAEFVEMVAPGGRSATRCRCGLSSTPWSGRCRHISCEYARRRSGQSPFAVMALRKNRHRLLTSPDGRSIFNFNRRIFSYGEMIQELRKVSTEGTGRWNSGADTGTLLKSFSTWAVFRSSINDSERTEWMGIMAAASKHSVGDHNL